MLSSCLILVVAVVVTQSWLPTSHCVTSHNQNPSLIIKERLQHHRLTNSRRSPHVIFSTTHHDIILFQQHDLGQAAFAIHLFLVNWLFPPLFSTIFIHECLEVKIFLSDEPHSTSQWHTCGKQFTGYPTAQENLPLMPSVITSAKIG